MSKHRSGRSTSRPAGKAPVAGLPVNKNDEVMLDIIGMTHEGEGVGRVEGFTLFVQGALPGESPGKGAQDQKAVWLRQTAEYSRSEQRPHRGALRDL